VLKFLAHGASLPQLPYPLILGWPGSLDTMTNTLDGTKSIQDEVGKRCQGSTGACPSKLSSFSKTEELDLKCSKYPSAWSFCSLSCQNSKEWMPWLLPIDWLPATQAMIQADIQEGNSHWICCTLVIRCLSWHPLRSGATLELLPTGGEWGVGNTDRNVLQRFAKRD
jgi:hypothetical protein